MRSGLIKEFTDMYDRYLRDESSEEGLAVDISFPETAEETAELIRKFRAEDSDYTIQGGLSGIRGEAVPRGGHIINMSKMAGFKGITQTDEGEWVAEVQPGMTLDDLNGNIARAARGKGLVWPPAPSEGSACIGGIAFCGAFGMNVCGCGETSGHIHALEYVSKNGETVSLTDSASIRKWLGENNTEKRGSCITGLSLRLMKRPEIIWGTAFFFESEEDALCFADILDQAGDKKIASMEYIDAASLQLIETSRESLPAMSAVPPVPEGTAAVIYVETEGDDESEEEAVEESMMSAAEAAAECGADLDTAWAFTGEAETARFHDLRHAVTESATQKMASLHADDRSLHLISIDIKEDAAFSELLRRFRKISGDRIKSVVCGSVGVPVIRVIMIPENTEQLHKGEEIRSRFMHQGGQL
ncbi:MAG: FAD-binding protein [Mogibacterium sp.]|nr:FAD-binding protein [Mogibacterium sp.]